MNILPVISFITRWYVQSDKLYNDGWTINTIVYFQFYLKYRFNFRLLDNETNIIFLCIKKDYFDEFIYLICVCIIKHLLIWFNFYILFENPARKMIILQGLEFQFCYKHFICLKNNQNPWWFEEQLLIFSSLSHIPREQNIYRDGIPASW